MTFIAGIEFTTGKFHATPWGRHVNEGIPEWPPSGWRFVRAVWAVWRRKFDESEHEKYNEPVKSVITKLASSEPPDYILPPVSFSHERHYMPWRKNWNKNKEKSTTLVFDTYIYMEKGAIVLMRWPDVDFSDEEKIVIDEILKRLSYLGRSESWVSVRRLSEDDWNSGTGFPCRPYNRRTENLNDNMEDIETVQVLVPDSINEKPELRWNGWFFDKKTYSSGTGWNIFVETKDIHKNKLIFPPGGRWLTYFFPSQSVFGWSNRRLSDKHSFIGNGTESIMDAKVRESSTGYYAFRYALDGTILPGLEETIYLAELSRRYLQGVYGRLFEGGSSPVFSGKDAEGRQLSGHKHAFFLPTDEDGDGRLDHLLIYSPVGFDKDEVTALDEFVLLRRPGGGLELRLVLIKASKKKVDDSIPLLAVSKVWRSVTPFIPTRHFKRRGRKRDTCSMEEFPGVVLAEELVRQNFPEVKRISRIDRAVLWDFRNRRPAVSGRSMSWLRYRRKRVLGGGRRGSHPGAGFEIEFREKTAGPIALGYAAHFGLGLFAPAD